MPVERHPISVSQFCELLALDPSRFRGVECNRPHSSVTILLEPDEEPPTDGETRERD